MGQRLGAALDKPCGCNVSQAPVQPQVADTIQDDRAGDSQVRPRTARGRVHQNRAVVRELGPDDVVMTVFTDSEELYKSRLAEMTAARGPYTELHAARDPVRTKQGQAEVCLRCHKQQRADFMKASSHPVRQGRMACTDCHNVHGSPGPSSLIKPTLNQTCYSCHADKRGPQLWEHAPVVENCANSKTVTILDFGQAVPITNEERETALDLLTVLGHLDTSKQGLRRLNQRFFADKPDGGLTKEDLKFVWAAPKKMDSFIRLLAAVSQKGGKVPLSTVHWVLALNRQFVLGAKLDQPIEKEVVGMVVNHKLGLKLGSYNTIKGATEKVTQWAGNIGHCLGSWAFKAPEPPKEGEGTVKAMGSDGQYTDVIDMISQQAKKETLQPKKKSSFGWYPEELLGQ